MFKKKQQITADEILYVKKLWHEKNVSKASYLIGNMYQKCLFVIFESVHQCYLLNIPVNLDNFDNSIIRRLRRNNHAGRNKKKRGKIMS